MTPEQFIAIWKDNKLTERGGAQAHFDDLCDLLGVEKPRDPDNYCFERGAKKSAGGDGWADVWKRGCFGWENKKPGRDLDAALKQLTDYALQLDNPPLLVVSDRERIIIHTAFTGYPDEPREIGIEELINPANLQLLRWVFTDPIKLRPEKSTAAITEEAAGHFAALAKTMRCRGLDGQQVAHFLVQCLFCMFAEDEQLLPANIFTDLLKNAGTDTAKAGRRIATLFTAMQQSGGEYGDHDIPWFNGGLFKTVDVPALTVPDLTALYAAAADMDWRAIDPTIFGTLFERGLDPTARAPLGAHYTDTATIAKLITPLIIEPLLAEWQAAKAVIAAGHDKKQGNKAYKEAQAAYSGFLARLNRFQVLDPACGSGNFLYLTLKALRDLEKLAHIEAQEYGFEPQLLMQTGPHNIRGIEINEYAAELARVTVWIGDIQWCRRNGREIARNPILRALDGIEHRDALIASPPDPLLNQEGERERSERGVVEAPWPTADVIIGNPPFLGDKMMRGELGDEYVEKLRKCYEGRVPGGADLVTYWFEKARAQIENNPLPNPPPPGEGVMSPPSGGRLEGGVRAGFVATNSIRGGANRKVLQRICESGRIFTAWSDEPWVNDGAAVRVSLVCFEGKNVGANCIRPPLTVGENGNDGGDSDKGTCHVFLLNGNLVAEIYADLTSGSANLTSAARLKENGGFSFMGVTKSGPFEIAGELARSWLGQPNPNGKPNSDVLFPAISGQDLAKRPVGDWIINFSEMTESEASLYELPFSFAQKNIKAERQKSKTPKNRDLWWLFERSRPEMFKAFGRSDRYIATSKIAKHRIFVWSPASVLPLNTVIVVAHDDDAVFGILQSRFHEVWTLMMAAFCGVGNDPTYTPTSTFETFPFPAGITPSVPANAYACNPHVKAIATAAVTLNQLRENWLNPPEWVDWVITSQEEKAGYPKRPVAKPGHEADLKKRTLTNLYNARPAWLDNAHKTLDKAVATAYGWDDYTPEMTDAEILSRLLALNLERAKEASP